MSALGSFQRYVTQWPHEITRGLRPRTRKAEGLIVHATAGDWADGTLGWWQKLLRLGELPFLYNYLIDRGTTPETRRIWRIGDPSRQYVLHAGFSSWSGKRTTFSLNSTTEGIALANDNGSDGNLSDDNLTPFQRDALLWLCVVRCRVNRIDPLVRVRSHGEVSGFRGKTDPLPSILNMDELRANIARHL